jgi:hypothetical protein
MPLKIQANRPGLFSLVISLVLPLIGAGLFVALIYYLISLWAELEQSSRITMLVLLIIPLIFMTFIRSFLNKIQIRRLPFYGLEIANQQLISNIRPWPFTLSFAQILKIEKIFIPSGRGTIQGIKITAQSENQQHRTYWLNWYDFDFTSDELLAWLQENILFKQSD